MMFEMGVSKILYAGIIAVSVAGCKSDEKKQDTKTYCVAGFEDHGDDPSWCESPCHCDNYKHFRKTEKMTHKAAEEKATRQCSEGLNSLLYERFKQEGH